MEPNQSVDAGVARVSAEMVAHQGARRIAELIKPTGRFIYAYDARNGTVSPGYNLLRHCGSVWSLVAVARHYGDMPTEIVQAERAMQWLLSSRTRKVGDALCVTAGDVAKLGGCGLAILALTELSRATGDRRWLASARAMGKFILRCRRDDGDFHHKVALSDFRPLDFRSDFYTGEALFGLLRLYQATGEARWLDVAQTSIKALDATDYGIAQQSHWMAYAIAELHRCSPSGWLLGYAGRLARSIVEQPKYRESQRTAPVATQVEGLMALVAIEQGESVNGRAIGPPRLQALKLSRDYLSVLMRNRLQDGGFVRAPDDLVVQIDHIQHATYAFFAYSNNVKLISSI